MLDKGCDLEIMQGASVTVTLCGKQYTFAEPPRRQGRAMLCEIMEIAPSVASTSPADRYRAVDKCLDFMYRWNTEMKRDRETIDARADEQEISIAFNAVGEMVAAPFAALAAKIQNAAAVAEPDGETNTPSPS
jgi:hypothetical protein